MHPYINIFLVILVKEWLKTHLKRKLVREGLLKQVQHLVVLLRTMTVK